MNAKHTPGPWRTGQQSDGQWLVHADIGGPGRTVLAATMLDNYGSQVGMNEANAQLIAAAPELLEACRQIVWKLSHNHMSADGVSTHPGTIDRNDATVRMAMEAIEKATAQPIPA